MRGFIQTHFIDFLFTVHVICLLTKRDFYLMKTDMSIRILSTQTDEGITYSRGSQCSKDLRSDKSSDLCGERGGNHQMINDNDAPLKNRSFRFLRGSQWRVRESDRWRVVRPRTHTHIHTHRLLQRVDEGAKGNGLRRYSLTPFVRCKYKSVSCSPSAVTTSHSYVMRP